MSCSVDHTLKSAKLIHLEVAGGTNLAIGRNAMMERGNVGGSDSDPMNNRRATSIDRVGTARMLAAEFLAAVLAVALVRSEDVNPCSS